MDPSPGTFSSDVSASVVLLSDTLSLLCSRKSVSRPQSSFRVRGYSREYVQTDNGDAYSLRAATRARGRLARRGAGAAREMLKIYSVSRVKGWL